MNRFVAAIFCLGLILCTADTASAQTVIGPELVEADNGTELLNAANPRYSGIGAGLAVLGAALGIGRIGGSAVEAQARQPEIKGDIQTTMIIAAALIEGVALLAVIFCLLI